MNVLPYHHPDDEQFSLVFVTDDEDAFEHRMERERTEEHVSVLAYRDRVAGGSRFAVHTDTHRPTGGVPDFEAEEDLQGWLNEEFGDLLPVVQAVVMFYSELRGTDSDLNAYKEAELGKIEDVLNSVEWRQPVPDVGAQLLSEFVLTHPMPNTNHRTGLVLLDRYLSSFDSRVSVPDTGEPGEWYEWAAEYVEDSKRLLTLRRRYRVFRYAEELGYDVIRRKNGVDIALDEYDIGRPDAFERFTEKHRERTRTFVGRVLDQADAAHLRDRRDDGKRAFVDRL